MIRSYLYVPGNRADQIVKAVGLAKRHHDPAKDPASDLTGFTFDDDEGPEVDELDRPDAIIIDLEDAVAPIDKGAARLVAVAALMTRPPGLCVLVRINAGPTGLDDLEAIAPLGPNGIYVPKAELEALPDLGDIPFCALIETARGIQQIDELAMVPGVASLAIGEADLRAELRIDRSVDHVMWQFRMRLVVASAAAGIGPPTAPVHTSVRDLATLEQTSLEFYRSGFGGRSAIHPTHIRAINVAFQPTADQLDNARNLVAAYDTAAADGIGAYVSDDGSMIDEAVVREARRLLE